MSRASTPRDISESQKTLCYHCGLACDDDTYTSNDKVFCCAGCRTVYALLQGAELGGYYGGDAPVGLRPGTRLSERFAYLDVEEVERELLTFRSADRGIVTFQLPQIHCSACVWLLERIDRLEPAVISSRVHFPRRTVTIQFDRSKTSLRSIVELLSSLGYEPSLSARGRVEQGKNPNRSLYFRIGIAGFAFANIMLFSLPEYFTGAGVSHEALSLTFRIVSLVLATPVLLVSASGYFRGAWLSLRRRDISIDFPIAIGIGMLYARSVYDIVTGVGPGYLDSFSGLVFFLLVGKLFQRKLYERLDFSNDYRAYFPISSMRLENGSEHPVHISRLKPGDRIIVRHGELIPADAIIQNGVGLIDYAFVTGESSITSLSHGELVFAGGKQTGGAVTLELVRNVAESYLVSLWNNQASESTSRSGVTALADRIAAPFTLAVLFIAAATTLFWLQYDSTRLIHAVTSVLIVACPCALALASPFLYGTIQRIFSKKQFFIRSTDIVESLAAIDTILFDKTGTLTHSGEMVATFRGATLSNEEKSLVAACAAQSTHPASRAIVALLGLPRRTDALQFLESPGKGSEARLGEHIVRLGTASWCDSSAEISEPKAGGSEGTEVHIAIDGRRRGMFALRSRTRSELVQEFAPLRSHYTCAVLTGDSHAERRSLEEILGRPLTIRTGCSPHDKQSEVNNRAQDHHQVMMLGDGLNDAGALRTARVGIAVTEDIGSFTPGSDGILAAGSLPLLPRILAVARSSRRLLIGLFVLSFLYNFTGLYFAATGQLSPLVSAVLMPISSVSVVLGAVLGAQWISRREGIV